MYLFVVLFFLSSTSGSDYLNCEKREACQELFEIHTPEGSERPQTVRLIFNLTDVNYPRIAHLVESCQTSNYSTFGIDCAEFTNVAIAYYHIYLYPDEPSLLGLHIRTGLLALPHPNGLENNFDTMKKESSTQQKRNRIDEVTVAAFSPYHGFNTFDGIAGSAPKWMKLTNTVLQSISIALLALTAALTCIGR